MQLPGVAGVAQATAVEDFPPTMGTPLDVSLQNLRRGLFLPPDGATAAWFRQAAIAT
jgi:hypothetical protein